MWSGAGQGGSWGGPFLRRLAGAAALLFAALATAHAAPPATPPRNVLTQGSLRVIHHPRHGALARQVLTTVARPVAYPGLGSAPAPESTTVVLAANRDDFARASGGRAPEWAGGIAFPELRLIVVPAYPLPNTRPWDAEATLRHEVAHLVVHERLPAVPRWFHEGYAEMASGSWDAESAWQLQLAFLLGRAPPLDSLELEWPRGAERARLAYLLSVTAVRHLRERTGEDGFALLLQNWQRDGTLEAALRATFGMTLGQVEAEWRSSVRRRYGWLAVLSQAALIWVAASLIVLIAWIPRRRRNRVKLDAMRAEERMLPPPRSDGVDVQYPIG